MKNYAKKYTVIDAIGICFGTSKIITIGSILLTVIGSVIPFWLVYINADFIDGALNYVKTGDGFQSVIKSITVLAVLYIFLHFYSVIVKVMGERLILDLKETYNVVCVQKMKNFKYQYIENEEICNLVNRVLDWPGIPRIQQTFSHLLVAINVELNFLFISVVLFRISPLIIGLLAVVTIPLVVISIKSSKDQYNILRWNSDLARKSNYLEFEVLRNREVAAERCLFGFSGFFNEKFEEYFIKSLNNEKKIRVKWLIISKLESLLIILIFIGAIFALITQTKAGLITIGFFVSAANALYKVLNILMTTLPENIGNIIEDHEYFRDLSTFFSLEEEEKIQGEEISEINSIEFKDVYFKYPGTDTYILKGVSFVLDKESHYALVGKNGSGKSTIIKLILALYDVTKGQILINGKDLRCYNRQKLNKLFSTIYQDFAKYNISVRDNIALGNIDELGNEDRLDRVIQAGRLEEIIKKMPHGKDTYLGKTFEEGIDVSGGQWQKMAFARSMMRDHVVRILDEPTAALDPLEESRLYEMYMKLSKNAMTIFVSHRLGSTKLADKIILLDSGKIIGLDTHDNLMNSCSLYRKMFLIQKEWYDEDK